MYPIRIHPRFKIPVANRLSLAGFAVAYGDTSEGLWQGPIPTGYDLQKDMLTITLFNGDVELEIRDMVTAIHYEVIWFIYLLKYILYVNKLSS